MKCTACGAEVVEQAVFCHQCGARLNPQRADVVLSGEGPAGQPGGGTSAGPDDAAGGAAPVVRIQQAAGTRAPDEPDRELWRGEFCAKAMLGQWILGGLATALLVALAIWRQTEWIWITVVVLVLLYWAYQVFILLYRKASIRYRLTARRFYHERGVLRRKVSVVEVIHIDDIAFEQSLLERLTGVGTIRIASSDRSDPELRIWGIEKAKDAFSIIDKARQAERDRRGLRVEQV